MNNNKSRKTINGYTLFKSRINITCSADDDVLITENKDELN